ncbi:MAG: DUF1254 domain-containing protein [Rhizobiaceae bacterium]
MSRVIYAILLGLVGAGIVHIAILLMLPALSERDSWSRLAEAGELYSVVNLHGADGKPPLVTAYDPMFDARACRFDLSEGIVHVFAEGKVPFWSASVYDRKGQNLYSFNDRTASGGDLDFAVVTPVQMIEIRKELPPEFQSSIFVETQADQGMVVVRAFVPDETWRPIIARYLDSLACTLE